MRLKDWSEKSTYNNFQVARSRPLLFFMIKTFQHNKHKNSNDWIWTADL